MEHVHADVICELQLQLQCLAGADSPNLFHRFIRITWSSVTTDALLIDIMNVHHVSNVCRICEDPFLGGAKDGTGVDPGWIELLAVDAPMACGLIKAPVARHGGLTDVGQRSKNGRNRARIRDVLCDAELQQRNHLVAIHQIEFLAQFAGEIDYYVQPFRRPDVHRCACHWCW